MVQQQTSGCSLPAVSNPTSARKNQKKCLQMRGLKTKKLHPGFCEKMTEDLLQKKMQGLRTDNLCRRFCEEMTEKTLSKMETLFFSLFRDRQQNFLGCRKSESLVP